MTVTAIILAAGFSTRMGTPNKLLQSVGAEPVLRGVVRAALAVCTTPPLVVLGHEAADVRASIADLLVRFTVNPDPAQGQASSVRRGLAEVEDAETTLVMLGDQPFLTADDLRALLDAHDAHGASRITVPMRGTDRGNPIAIPAALRREIQSSGRNVGCGSFTRKNPDLTHPFHTDAPGFFVDIDTPDDLNAARATARGLALS